MFTKRSLFTILFLILISTIIVACGASAPEPASEPAEETEVEEAEAEEAVEEEAEASEGGTIKIGVLAPLTGGSAADGEEMTRGVELAIEEINAAGGINGYTFEVVVGDTQDQAPDAVVSAIEKITADEDVKVMMTGYASTTNFEIEMMAEMKMPYLISANAVQTQDIISQDPDKYNTVWSLVPSYAAYETELPRLLELWNEQGNIELKNRKVAIVNSDNPYSDTIAKGLRANFEELGWEITVDETVPFGEVLDWRTILADIRQDPPDIIINTDYQVGNEVSFLEQFLEDPTDSLVFMQYGPSVPEFVELTADSSTGVLYNLLGGMILSPNNQMALDFIDKFEGEYGVQPGTYGYALYQSVYIYADALAAVGNPDDTKAIGEAIGATERDTATGRIAFDPETHLAIQGDDYVPIQFYQLNEGERTLLHPQNFSTGEIQPSPWQAPLTAPAGEDDSEAMVGEGGVIKIGVLAPLTGGSAADGEEMTRGVELAVEEINAAGGVNGYTFEFVIGDTQDQAPDAVVSAIEKITADEDVKVMMTGYASTTNFEIEMMAEMKMPYLISANAVQTQDIISQDPDKYNTVWSLVPSYAAYETELPRLLELWNEQGNIELKNRKVAIVNSDNPYSDTIARGLQANFEELGWEITVFETVPFGEVLDWRTILADIRQDPPDIIINTDYQVGNEVSFLEQFLEDPTDSLVFMQYGPSVPEFVELTADSSTGVLYNLLGGMILSPNNQLALDFIEKFEGAYGVQPGTYGYALYQSVYIYADALAAVGNPDDTEAIGEAIGATERDTATGRIAFDPETHLAIQGDEHVPIQFYQLNDGERTLLHPQNFSTGEIQPSPWQGE